MSIHIDQVTSNVTVTLQRKSDDFPSMPVAPEPSDAAVQPSLEDLPPPDAALARTSTLPESGQRSASTGQESDAPGSDRRKPLSAVVDPRALTDRVYQLMREELRIARERE